MIPDNAVPVSDLKVYAIGLVAQSVCVPETWLVEEIEWAANIAAPTGISSRWSVSSDETFKGGQPNPCVCDQVPSRRHYLMEC